MRLGTPYLGWLNFRSSPVTRIRSTCAYPAKASSPLRIGQMPLTLSSGSIIHLATRHSCLTRSFQVAFLVCKPSLSGLHTCLVIFLIQSLRDIMHTKLIMMESIKRVSEMTSRVSKQLKSAGYHLCYACSSLLCVVSYYIVILRAIAFVLSFLFSHSFNRPS